MDAREIFYLFLRVFLSLSAGWFGGIHQANLEVVAELWIYNLDFEDCLSIAYMERQRLKEIYSYDRGFDRVGNVERVEPKG